MPKIIALTGLIGSGKSTVAAHLIDKHHFTLVKFAGGLKTMLRALLTYSLLPPAVVEDMIEGIYKETPAAVFQGKTPRMVMQTLGTEWGRTYIGEDFWAHLAAMRIKQLTEFGASVVVDDCRYANEAAVIKGLGGEVWKVTRPGTPMMNHSSELEQHRIVAKRELTNSGTVEELLTAVSKAVTA